GRRGNERVASGESRFSGLLCRFARQSLEELRIGLESGRDRDRVSGCGACREKEKGSDGGTSGERGGLHRISFERTRSIPAAAWASVMLVISASVGGIRLRRSWKRRSVRFIPAPRSIAALLRR